MVPAKLSNAGKTGKTGGHCATPHQSTGGIWRNPACVIGKQYHGQVLFKHTIVARGVVTRRAEEQVDSLIPIGRPPSHKVLEFLSMPF